MDGYLLFALLALSGTGGVFGATVNLTMSNPSPTEGNNPVTMTCVFSAAAGEKITFVYIDGFKSQHDGYRNLARFNLETGAKEWMSDGLALQNRGELSAADGSVTLSLNSVTCDDTKQYKCDLTLDKDHRDKDYNMEVEPLNVKDSSGETCGRGQSTVYSLPIIMCVLFVGMFLR